MSTTTSLPQELFAKVGAMLPTPSLPKRFDESTPRTTPPLSPTLHAATNQHDEQLLLATQLLDSTTSTQNEASVALDGYKLTIGDVVAASRFHKKVKIDDAPAIKARIDESVDFLRSKVRSTSSDPTGCRKQRDGLLTLDDAPQLVNSVYGVTTGFGGVGHIHIKREGDDSAC